MTASPDRFVTAPLDASGCLVTAVGYETEREAPVDHRGLPSPFLTFIVTLDAPVVLAESGGERGLDVVVAGLSTEPEIVRMPRRQVGLQAAVHPLAARRLFGMPAAELARRSVEGEDVLGSIAPRLRERLAEAADWDERFAIFAAEMGLPVDLPPGDDRRGRPSVRLTGQRTTALRATGQRTTTHRGADQRTSAGRGSGPRPEVVEAWRLLTVTRGQIRIDELAARVFLSRRRLSTLFAAEFGLSPKEAARTMRFTHAVTRIGARVRVSAGDLGGPRRDGDSTRGGSPPSEGAQARGLDLARVAAECGYADQSHLDREFRGFAGTSPSGWIAEEFPNIQAGGHRYAREWEA